MGAAEVTKPPKWEAKMSEADVKQIEALLVKKKLSAGDLKAVLDKMPGLKQFKPRRLFPEGTINPEVMRVEYDLTPPQLQTFVTELGGTRSSMIREWRVFPLGIINPEQFRVIVDFGRPHRR